MAVVVTTVAQVAIPPSLIGQPSQPNNAKGFEVSCVIQASDYSSGFATATIATACGVNLITGAVILSVQVAAGTTQFGFSVHDIANNKVRFFSAITNQTTATDYTAVNGDIIRLFVVGV